PAAVAAALLPLSMTGLVGNGRSVGVRPPLIWGFPSIGSGGDTGGPGVVPPFGGVFAMTRRPAGGGAVGGVGVAPGGGCAGEVVGVGEGVEVGDQGAAAG